MAALPSEWIAVGLILAALFLVALDLHLVGQGTLAAGGVVALVLGVLLLASPDVVAAWRVRPELVVVVALAYLAYAAVAARGALAVRRLGGPRALLPAAGQRAIALTDLAPTGIVRLDREEWSATADPALPPAPAAASGQTGAPGSGHGATNRLQASGAIVAVVRIRAGEPVEVVGQEGLRLRVRRLTTPALPPKEA